MPYFWKSILQSQKIKSLRKILQKCKTIGVNSLLFALKEAATLCNRNVLSPSLIDVAIICIKIQGLLHKGATECFIIPKLADQQKLVDKRLKGRAARCSFLAL